MLIDVVLPFLLPFLAFLVWRLLVTRGRGLLEQTPWYALTAIGLLLVVVSLVSIAVLPRSDTDVVYVPPRVEDGKVVPGHFVPAPPRP
jgi:hypothetical protein